MQYGMNLLLWTAQMHDGMLPILETLKSMGYDGVELPIFDPSANWALWGKRLDDFGLQRTAVTIATAEENPIDADVAVRARAVVRLKRVLDACAAAGVKLLCGPFHSALGVFTGKGPTDDERRWGEDSMRAVAEHAATLGITLALEYLNRFEIYFLTCVADTVRFVEAVRHPNCQMLYDTFHAHIEERDGGVAIFNAREHIRHVHISENDRSTPGVGSVQWTKTFNLLKAIGYDGWLVVEAFGTLLPELVAATKIWRRMYETEEQLARDALAFMKSHVQAS